MSRGEGESGEVHFGDQEASHNEEDAGEDGEADDHFARLLLQFILVFDAAGALGGRGGGVETARLLIW